MASARDDRSRTIGDVIVLVAALCLLLGAVLGAVLGAFVSRSTQPAEHRRRSLDPRPAAVEPALPTQNPALAAQVLSAINVGVAVVDRSDTAVFANRAARQIRVVEGDRLTMPGLVELVRAVTDSGQPNSLTLDMASSSIGPELLTYLVSAIPLPEDGRVGSVLLTFSDVTESRRLERVRRDFVANVSHELKTPVGALTLLAEAVQDAADDPDAVQRFSQRMQREGARLGRLVQELIELSRLQGAEALPGQQLVAVSQVLSEALDRCRLLAEQSGITVLDRTEPGLLVRGNETQLTTAVSNLVDNAIAYSSERTKVSVSARSVVDASAAEWVEISVTDQGIGIAEPDLDRVFERFFRVDPARSRATGGTGLGLAIVKHIATNHGGAVSVWSVVGSGSTFTIKLPLAARRIDAARTAPGFATSAVPTPTALNSAAPNSAGPTQADRPARPAEATPPPTTSTVATHERTFP